MKMRRSGYMKWKKIGFYFGCLFVLAILFSGFYYLSYVNALRQFNQNAVERNDELISYLEHITNNEENSLTKEGVQDSVTVDTSHEDIVMPTTVYKLEIYDIITNKTSVETLNPPSEFIGLNREELIKLLADEMTNVPLEEHQKGLVSFVVVSFSKDEIVLRKTYNMDTVQFQYYLALKNGKVVVYYSDKKTVYEYTEIDASRLSEQNQSELCYGKYVRDENELYAILESYSS